MEGPINLSFSTLAAMTIGTQGTALAPSMQS